MYAVANFKIEEEKDRKVAVITSSAAILLLLIVAYFTTFMILPKLEVDVPPLRSDEVIEEFVIDNLELARNADDAGGTGGGMGSNDKIAPPSPQTSKIVTDKSSSTNVFSGNSHNNNSTNATNGSSTVAHNNNPFGNGGNNTSGSGAGTGPFGDDVGQGGNGPNGPGSGSGGRVRLNDPNTSGIIPDHDATINLKVTINADGKILAVSNIPSQTTTTDQTIINQVISRVKRDVKYSKAPGTANTTQYITVKLYAQ